MLFLLLHMRQAKGSEVKNNRRAHQHRCSCCNQGSFELRDLKVPTNGPAELVIAFLGSGPLSILVAPANMHNRMLRGIAIIMEVSTLRASVDSQRSIAHGELR